MKPLKIVGLIFLLLVIIAIAVVCYFVFRPDKNIDTSFKAGVEYYLNALRQETFKYPDETYIDLQSDDSSYCYLSDDNKKLTVRFIKNQQPDLLVVYTFLVTEFKQTKNGTTANVQIILDGELFRCQLVADKTNIIITADNKRTVRYGTENGETNETVIRTGTVLSFSMAKPGYLN